MTPGTTDHAAWAAAIRDLGFRHTAEWLGAWGVRPGFRVLDGLWYRPRGLTWLRVDRAYLSTQREHWRRAGDERRAAAEALLARAEEVLDRDPMGLRRVVVHELVLLLQDHPAGITARAATDLGLDEAEATELAAAVTACLGPAGRLDGEAAEGLQEALADGRLRLAEQYAARLSGVVADHELRDLRAAVTLLRDHTDDALTLADVLLRTGEHRRSADIFLRTARHAVDEPQAVVGLLRAAEAETGAAAEPTARGPGRSAITATRSAAPPGLSSSPRPGTAAAHRVRTEVALDRVTVAWDPAPAQSGKAVRYRVVRFPAGKPQDHVDVGPPTDEARIVDRDVEPGSTVRYGVLPVLGGRVAGRARTSAPVLVAPDVEGLTLVATRAGVTARWRASTAATAIRVVRQLDDEKIDVTCRQDSFEDLGPVPGTYTYQIRCAYREPDGRAVVSPGVRARMVVEEWPQPVADLTGELCSETGPVRLSWTPPVRGEVLLVPWTGPPPEPGTDLPDGFATEQPAPPLGSKLLSPPAGTSMRVVAVTVLGGRAVAGAGLLVEAQTPVRGMTAEREVDDSVRLGFDWPDPAPLVLVGWRQGTVDQERRITRSAYLRAGLALPATAEAVEVTVTPVAAGDAEFVLSGAGHVHVPPRVRLSYRLLKQGWRAGSRRTVEVRAELPDPAVEPAGCPDFLLVGRESVAPLDPRHGTEELRLPGDRLAAGEPVRTEIDLRDRARPYLLRGFLLGAGAPAAQLDHPPPETLVVR
ncbi:hypothetical protein ACFW93_15685 [Streptomyces canus]|uniref:hypothetical protein n=1 Tax=Streptomyces canus TaxID=58343 RepID=UPI00368C547E